MSLTEKQSAKLLRIGAAVVAGAKKGGSASTPRKTAANKRNIALRWKRKRKRTPAQTAALRQNARRSK